MSTYMQSETQDALSRIFELIGEIVEKSANGIYIYRGEPEYYEEYDGKVSSTLYRISPTGFDSGEIDLERMQKSTLDDARNYTHERVKEDFELLTELQHYGSETNLIDFTTDYHIALFFACDGSHDKDGRVILFQRTEETNEKYRVEQPWKPLNRILAQKSIFVQPPNGFIDPKDLIIVNVPAHLKQWILIHLRKFQDISTESIYNDLHGYIKHKNFRSSNEAILPLIFADGALKDFADQNLGLEEKQNRIESAIGLYTQRLQYTPYEVETYVKQGRCYGIIGKFDQAIETFNKAILLEPNYAETYYYRGVMYFYTGKCECAMKDYNQVIRLNPNYTNAYFNRGTSYFIRGELDLAIRDFTKVIELNPNYTEAHTNRGMAYHNKGSYINAIKDYNKAVSLNPNAGTYYNRGLTRLSLKEWQRAKSDLMDAQNMGLNIVDKFHKNFKSVADFEQKHSVKLPKDIVAMLTLPHL